MRVLLPISLLIFLISCAKEPPTFVEADFFCPGDPSGICDDTDSTELVVGAAAVLNNPRGFEQWINLRGSTREFDQYYDRFLDCGYDQLCPEDPGYSGPDPGEGDGLLNPGEPWQDLDNDGVYTEGTDTWQDCGLDGLCSSAPNYPGPDTLEGDGIFQPSAEVYIEINGRDGYEPSIDTLRDCGLDGLCPADPGYTSPDEGEGDGVFQSIWMAGFSTGRAANGQHDDLWASALYLEQGNTSIGVVTLDLLGIFYDEVLKIREQARQELGLDHVLVGVTHGHEGPDTIGIWGVNDLASGLNADFMASTVENAVQALRQAQAAARPAEVGATVREIEPNEWQGRGVNNFNMDMRDPSITDAFIRVLQFRQSGSGAVIATMVNWPNHPESLSSYNLNISSDFPHYLREGMRNGVEGFNGPVAGVAGVPIYWQGALGGMMSPLDADTLDVAGNDWHADDFDKAKATGEGIALMVLESLPALDWFEAPRLRVRTKSFKLPVVNTGYHVAINAGLFDRETYDWDQNAPITDTNRPSLLTEVDVLDIGRATAVSIPGELFPEYWLGGTEAPYVHTGPLQTIIDPNNPNPPDLSLAPGPPYLQDRILADYPFVLGLTNDELGYIVPPWQWELGAPAYLEEAEGHHYEETNSLGPDTGPTILGHLETLLDFTPPGWE